MAQAAMLCSLWHHGNRAGSRTALRQAGEAWACAVMFFHWQRVALIPAVEHRKEVHARPEL